MFLKIVITAVVAAAIVAAQDFDYDEEPKPRQAPARLRPAFSGPASGSKQAQPPVAILKQINRHNEDGSYTYGYESADGSFKIETKLPNGEVKGKYGFVDDVGKTRVVEYGATKYGFAPQGEGITVPPPTLQDETTLRDGRPNPDYQDQYYEPEPAPRPAPRPRPQPQPRPQQNALDSYAASPLQFAPAQQHNPSPVPQRPAFSGAALTTDIEFSPQPRPPSRSFAPQVPAYRPAPQQTYSFEPAPIQEEDNYSEQSPSLPPFRPAPVSRPAPVQYTKAALPQQYAPVPRQGPTVRQSGTGGGILDQLAKDYALPEGSAPALHDISFGFY